MNPEGPRQEPQKSEKLSGTEKFETKEGDIVTLKWHIVNPKDIQRDAKDEARVTAERKSAGTIIFLSGVNVEADSKPVVDDTQNFANASGMPAYSISTRIDNPNTENSQEPQAEAIRKFLSTRNDLHDGVTVVGNSQGATKGISVVAMLEESNIKVHGFIVTSPGGLSERDPSELTKNFFKDSLTNTKVPINLAVSAGWGMAKEMLGHPTEFLKRVDRESLEAATPNPRAKDIKAPVVAVFGLKDIALGAGKLIPETAHNQSLEAQEARQKELEKVFPNSAGIKVIEPTKKSEHTMHYMRSEEIAESTLYMLRRMERKQP